MSAATCRWDFDKCRSSTAPSMKGELEAPNGTTVNLYVWNSVSELSRSEGHRNLVKFLSDGCSLMWRNAFSISVDRPKAWTRKCSKIAHRLFKNGGPTVRQSFKLANLALPRQLQSYTIRMGVVTESFFTGW